MTDTELKIKGFDILRTHLGDVEMEKFIAMIHQDHFDYTRWRSELFQGVDGETISKSAMKNRTDSTTKPGKKQIK